VSAAGGTNNYAAVFPTGNVGVGTSTPNVMLDVNGAIALREYNYTGTINSTNNNMDFTGGGNTSSFIRVASTMSANVELTGLAGGYSGKIIKIYNASTEGIRVKHLSGSSNSSNQIKTSTSGDLMISPGLTYEFLYSGADGKWLVTSSSPGGITTFGQESVNINASTVLPASTASYIQVTAPNSLCSGSGCNVTLEDGVTVGQIVVIQNNGPGKINFTGTNFSATNNDDDLVANNTIPFMWSGTKWVQMAAASSN
jgi:hypothetical protein